MSHDPKCRGAPLAASEVDQALSPCSEHLEAKVVPHHCHGIFKKIVLLDVCQLAASQEVISAAAWPTFKRLFGLTAPFRMPKWLESQWPYMRSLEARHIPWQESRTSHRLDVHEEVPQLGEGLLAPQRPRAPHPPTSGKALPSTFSMMLPGASARADWPRLACSEPRHHSLWQCRPVASPRGFPRRTSRPFKHKQLRQLLMSTSTAPTELENASAHAFYGLLRLRNALDSSMKRIF